MPMVDMAASYLILVLMLAMNRMTMRRIIVIAHTGEQDLFLKRGEVL